MALLNRKPVKSRVLQLTDKTLELQDLAEREHESARQFRIAAADAAAAAERATRQSNATFAASTILSEAETAAAKVLADAEVTV